MNRQLRAVLWLIPVLALGAWLVWQISRPADSVESDANNVLKKNSSDAALNDGGSEEVHLDARNGASAEERRVPELFTFDPNTVDYHSLIRLGFARGEALGIIKYRERGKVFEIAEDFAACYQVSEAMYRQLEPYITIGEEYRLEKFPVREKPAVSADASKVSEVKARQVPAFHEKPSIDLNAADTTLLVTVNGIGSLTAGRIVEYRERLGGFVDVMQLAEVRGVTEQNFERILPQIHLSSVDIQKININFAPARKLSTHPYIEAKALRKLLKIRQLKGGWSTPEELLEDDIFTEEQLAKLLPYFSFE